MDAPSTPRDKKSVISSQADFQNDNFVKQNYKINRPFEEPKISQKKGAKIGNIFKLDLAGSLNKGKPFETQNCTPTQNQFNGNFGEKLGQFGKDDLSHNIFANNNNQDSRNLTFQHILEQSSHKFSNAEALLNMGNHNTNIDDLLNENILYYSERKIRKLYDDDE